MEWQIEEKGNVSIVKCSGRFDCDVSSNFKQVIKDLVNDGKVKIVISLADVNFIDSTGLGSLVACLRAANQKEGDVKLCRLQSEIRMVIELTRLHRVFNIFDTEDEAIESFSL